MHEPQPNPQPLFYTARQFAAIVGVSYPTVLRWLKRNKLRALPLCRYKKIPHTELKRFLT